MTDASNPLDKAALLEAYRQMKTIREFEERLHIEFAKGDIPGFVHLYAGEEASAKAAPQPSPKDLMADVYVSY